MRSFSFAQHRRLARLSGMVAAAAILLPLGGCKIERWRKTRAEPVQSEPVPLPQRLTGDGETGTDMTASFDVDDKTGRAKSNLVLRLDYFPAPRPGVTNLPACYRAFPSDFEVGAILCTDKPDMRRPLLAKNLEQDCYTDPKVQRVVAEEPLVLLGCHKAQVLTYKFQPTLRVDLEVRELN